jgi:hypothetical protein
MTYSSPPPPLWGGGWGERQNKNMRVETKNLEQKFPVMEWKRQINLIIYSRSFVSFAKHFASFAVKSSESCMVNRKERKDLRKECNLIIYSRNFAIKNNSNSRNQINPENHNSDN